MRSPSAEAYFRRFGFCGRQIAAPPAPDLGLVVVVPCFNEPDLPGALASLAQCERPECAVEIIVVINASAAHGPAVRKQNLAALAAAEAWAADQEISWLQCYFLHHPDLPAKQAGVGLARKIGMDEAVRRLDDAGRVAEGVIAGFDTDCRCERNYLRSLERHFRTHPESPGCSVHFEHPLAGPLDSAVYEAVAAYELHLRYYVQALRFAGFPFAHHTVGSSMAVRAEAYVKQGGMNKRQAGEDFYFLQKIMALGGYTDLTVTTVFPSPRASDRVPFGTGKAVRAILEGAAPVTYPLEAFDDLRVFLAGLPALHEAADTEADLRQMPASIATFLDGQGFAGALAEMRRNTASEGSFRKRFFRWFDGFRAMKFLHHARDHFYGERAVAAEAGRLLARTPGVWGAGGSGAVRELLAAYREVDRGASSAAPCERPLAEDFLPA